MAASENCVAYLLFFATVQACKIWNLCESLPSLNASESLIASSRHVTRTVQQELSQRSQLRVPWDT
jgi:hypothetical protein